jgi:hypothetical protein
MPKKSLDLVKMENEKLMKDKEMEAKFAMLNKEIEDVPVSKKRVSKKKVSDSEEVVEEPVSVSVEPVSVSVEKPKKQPKVIEEIVEEEEPEPIIVRKIIKKKPKKIIEEVEEEEEPVKKPKKVVGRKRMDTLVEDSSIEMLRKEMENEVRRRLMTTLFDY